MKGGNSYFLHKIQGLVSHLIMFAKKRQLPGRLWSFTKKYQKRSLLFLRFLILLEIDLFGSQASKYFLILKYPVLRVIFLKFSWTKRGQKIKSLYIVAFTLKRKNTHFPPFNLQPATLYTLISFFQASALKKMECHTYKSEKNQAGTLKKSG